MAFYSRPKSGRNKLPSIQASLTTCQRVFTLGTESLQARFGWLGMLDELGVDLRDVIPVKRETVQARVHGALRHFLMIGRFQPGQALKINELAKAFGTSAQPIRESIRQLVAEKALEALPNRSARVPLMDVSRLEDLRRVRLAVEGLAAELGARYATPSEVATLERIVKAEIQADEEARIETSVALNLEFHFTLYRFSKSDILPSIIENLWLQVGPNIRRAAEVFDARGARGAEHHLKMLDALRRNDAEGVRRAIEQDINRFFDLLTGPDDKDSRDLRAAQRDLS
jgi:DNA-binding GntR family transcriptional regulator